MRTILLAILAFVSLAVAILQISRGGLDRIVGRIPFQTGERPFPIPLDLPAHIDISKGNTSISASKLPSGVYWAQKPFNDRLDPRATNAILQFTTGTAVVDTIPLKDSARSREFGLSGADSVLIDIRKYNGKSMANYRLGKPTPLKLPVKDSEDLDATSYLRSLSHGREDEVLVVSGSIAPLFNDNLRYLRDHHPFLIDPKTTSRIKLSQSGSEIVIERSSPSAPWMITKPMQLHTEQPAIAQLFITLAELSATQVKNPDEVTLPQLPHHQLRTVSLSRFDNPEPVTLTLYPPANPSDSSILATVSDRKAVFTLPRASIENIPGADSIPFELNSLRSRKLLSFDAQDLRGITIQSPSSRILLTRDPALNSWLLSLDNAPLQPVNELTLYTLVKTLLTQDIAGFVSDAPDSLEPYGLKSPLFTLNLAFFHQPQSTIAFGQAPDGKIYAHIEGSPIVYAISDNYFARIAHLPHQWRNTRIFDLSPAEVTSITLSASGKPPLKLSYDYLDDSWQAHILPLEEGKEPVAITDRLNTPRANYLLKTLCKLKATSWLPANSPNATKALANPPIAITIVSGDSSNPSAPRQFNTLYIAPAGDINTTPVFYARLANSKDAFLISRETIKTLTSNLLDQ